MSLFSFIVVLVIIAAAAMANDGERAGGRASFRNRALYCISIMILASSPILSLEINNLRGSTFNFSESLNYIWVGVFLCLPVPLLASRLFGKAAYQDFWRYLEGFPNSSKAGIIKIWLGATAIFALTSLLLTYT